MRVSSYQLITKPRQTLSQIPFDSNSEIKQSIEIDLSVYFIVNEGLEEDIIVEGDDDAGGGMQ
jgi:hypothetical protein